MESLLNSRKRHSSNSNLETLEESSRKTPKLEDHDVTLSIHERAEFDLKSLLDVSNVKEEDFSMVFYKIAYALMLHHRLKIQNGDQTTTYDILEAEFYLVDPVNHKDPFTHGEEEQGFTGMWYFHRVPKWFKKNADSGLPGGYRGGTRKGVDITFGKPFKRNEEGSASSCDTPIRDIRGGILLRTIRRSSDKIVICGPSLVVDEILKQSGSSGLSDLVDNKWKKQSCVFPEEVNSESQTVRLYLEPRTPKDVLRSPTLYKSPRIGLDLANANLFADRVKFIDRPYRFFLEPQLFKEKGRPQTFVGLLRQLKNEADPPSVELIAKIELITDSPYSKIISNYMEWYTYGWISASGDGGKTIGGYIGEKGVCASPEMWMKMMGALERHKIEQSVI